MKSIYLMLFISLSISVYSQQPGTLDENFGEGGKVTNQFNFLYCNTIALKNNGKILAGGYGTNRKNETGNLVAQYNADGSLDTEFGDSGRVVTAGTTSLGKVLVQQDGEIISAGSYQGSYVSLVRYNIDGSLDIRFGDSGMVKTRVAPELGIGGSADDAIIQQDGKIIVTGYGLRRFDGNYANFMIRYNSDGTLDESFADKGILLNCFENPVYSKIAVTLQEEGKIVIAGIEEAEKDIILGRYLTNGTLDKSFGEDGFSNLFLTDRNCTPGGIGQIITTLEGKILLAGGADTNKIHTGRLLLARFNSNGSIDSNFADNGLYVKADSKYSTSASSVMLQTDEKIITTGGSSYPDYFFLLMRFTKNGLIDSSFGEDGLAGTTFEKNFAGDGSGTLQKDGKIVMAGSVYNKEEDQDAVLARFNGSPVRQLSPIAKKIRRWIRNHTLQWQPIQDNDIAYYSIQQSSNGINGFKEIGRIKANEQRTMNNKQLVYSYSLTASSSNTQNSTYNTNYYRITAVSTSGSNITSDVIEDENVSSITVSPNPVKDVIKISGLPANQKSIINIINRNGNVVAGATAHASNYNLNVSRLNSGLYNVQVINNGKTQTVKFFKQ